MPTYLKDAEVLLEDVPVLKSMSQTLSLPEDAYECVITEIENMIRNNKFNKSRDKGANFYFEIVEGPYKGKTFSKFFTNKLTKRSSLTVVCRAVWGDEFEPEEMAQINTMWDFKRFLIGKPLKVILLLRHSALTDTYWYDVAFFLKSANYNPETAKIILPLDAFPPDTE